MVKRPEFKPALMACESVARAAYNPREADDFRDEMLKLSISKFGWLIPAFVDPSSELLSGHQRQRISMSLGAKDIPVVKTKMLPEGRRKAINLLFNRATNDMDNSDNSTDMRKALMESREDILESVAKLPDLDPLGREFFPVLDFKWLPVSDLLAVNTELGSYGMQSASEILIKQKMFSPLVATESGRLINGKGRLPAFASAGYDEVPVTVVGEEKADTLVKLVNLLTMDFTIHKQYADVLRFNSFRRANGTKESIGAAFRFDLFPNSADWDSPNTWEQWRQHYGTTVLDFGAGLLQDTYRMRSNGVDVVPFEPFLLQKDTAVIDPEAARTLLREFLVRIAAGVQFDSVFQNSVMNSVPFIEDRKHIVTLISSLCGPSTRVYCCAISASSTRAHTMVGNSRPPSHEKVGRASFVLDYEENVSIADISSLPKVQKFHKPREWYDLWSAGFQWVQSVKYADLVAAICKRPLPVDPAKLRAAVEFEFDLPYPNGSRVGLVDEALAAFSRRLSIKL